VYIRGLVLLPFHFLSFSPYTVICSSYLNKYLETSMSLPPPSSPSSPLPLSPSSPLSLLLPSALFLPSPYPTFVALALFSCFCSLGHVFTSKHGSSSVVPHYSSRDLMLELLRSSYHSSQVETTSLEPSGSLSHTLSMTTITLLIQSCPLHVENPNTVYGMKNTKP
jgi:hypothetical protein